MIGILFYLLFSDCTLNCVVWPAIWIVQWLCWSSCFIKAITYDLTKKKHPLSRFNWACWYCRSENLFSQNHFSNMLMFMDTSCISTSHHNDYCHLLIRWFSCYLLLYSCWRCHDYLFNFSDYKFEYYCFSEQHHLS